jgi:hypothetical protein
VRRMQQPTLERRGTTPPDAATSHTPAHAYTQELRAATGCCPPLGREGHAWRSWPSQRACQPWPRWRPCWRKATNRHEHACDNTRIAQGHADTYTTNVCMTPPTATHTFTKTLHFSPHTGTRKRRKDLRHYRGLDGSGGQALIEHDHKYVHTQTRTHT